MDGSQTRRGEHRRRRLHKWGVHPAQAAAPAAHTPTSWPVPAGSAEHAKQALDIATKYQPKLTRYERQQILQKTAEELVRRKEEISDVITYELGISSNEL